MADKPPPPTARVDGGVVLAAAAVAVVYRYRGPISAWWGRVTGAAREALAVADPWASVPLGGAKVGPMNQKLIAAALSDLPDASAAVRPGDPLFDEAMGGRVGDALGAPAWRYYAPFAGAWKDGKKRGGGTTCSTFLAWWMARAGWPRDLVDRAPDDARAPGSGFKPGESMSRFVGGSKRLGYYVATDAAGFELRPGDAYHVDHPPAPNSDHVGVVRSVGPSRGDGTREVVTLDGGQPAAALGPGLAGVADDARAQLLRGASARWRVRVLSADGKTLSLDGSPARLLGVVRAPAEVA